MNIKKILLAGLCLFGVTLASVMVKPMKAQADSAEPLFSLEEALSPVWEGEISYMESVLPVENEFGGIDPIALLYPIEEIIEVKNAALTVTYEQGKDYVVSKGKLIIADDGAIPILSYDDFHPAQGQNGFEAASGGYVCFHEGSWFHSKQIVVTYKHQKAQTSFAPQNKAELLQNVRKKLDAKEEIDLLVLGDSISVGANASGFQEINVSPYMPTYAELFSQGLTQQYGSKVNLTNPSVGGKNVSWGEQVIPSVLNEQKDLDLAVIAFGMNDTHTSADVYVKKINAIISSIQSKFPEADVLVVATMLPNPDAKNFNGNQQLFVEALLSQCEREGVAVANMTDMHKALLQNKRYADMTGNNVNHPNDYLVRVYAQTLLATLEEKVVQSPCTMPSDDDSVDGQKGGLSILSGCGAATSVVACGMSTLGMGFAMTKKTKKDD